MLIATTRLPVPLALVALTVIIAVVLATAVGVPEIKPVVVLMPSPAGSPVAAKLAGKLLVVIW